MTGFFLRCFFAGLLICALPAFDAAAQTEEKPDSVPEAYVSSPLSSTDRYEIIRSPFTEKNIFRIDRACGKTEFLVWNPDRKIWFWQSMRIPDLFPCIVDGRDHYQFFATTQDDHIFLIHTDTKMTWRLNRENMVWIHM